MVQDTFDLLGTPTKYQVPFATYKLSGAARTWWETIRFGYDIRTINWEVFERLFTENYFNADHQQALVDEFERLKQGFMIVTNYYYHFMELAQYS